MADGSISLADALQRLTPRKKAPGRLGPAAQRDAIPPSVGEAVPSASGLGGGVAWPLTEQPGTRVYGQPIVYTSPDGLMVIEMAPAKTLTMTDGNGDTGPFNLDEV